MELVIGLKIPRGCLNEGGDKMYCYKCGKQIANSAVFCSFCGEKIQTHQIISKTTGEYDREAIRIYLNNLLRLENANEVLQYELARLDDEYRYIKNNNYYATYILLDHLKEHTVEDECCHFYYDGKDVYIAVWSPYNTPIYTGRYLKKCHNWIKIDNYKDINNLNNWLVYRGIFDFPKKIEIRKRFFSKLEEFKAIAPVKFKENIASLKKNSDSYNKLSTDQKKASTMLQKAYDINIVPVQFRNIYAIYYLSNFMNTSMETFSSALLHLDLDEIKSKLDEIISNQQSIILKMAVLESQNSELLRKNQKMLSRLSSIEQNTELAAVYSNIAVTNSEACAWFSAATFFNQYLN